MTPVNWMLRNNVAWFLASLLMAVIVWVVAATQADPIVQTTFNNVPIQMTVPDDLIVTNAPRLMARVVVRAQQSVLNLLTVEDVVIQADLTNRSVGTHTVPLVVTVNRAGAIGADTQPTQLTVTLEQTQTEQKSVRLVIVTAPPIDYTYDPPTSETVQVEVRGATSQVSNVAEVRGEIDLANQRNPLASEITLVAFDANNRRLPEIDIQPRTVQVNVNIYPRDDVRQVAVRPNIQLETLQSDYVLSSISYEPQVMFVSGAKSELEELGATVDTTPISLQDRTTHFTVEVPLNLPDELLVLGETRTVTVTIGINPLTTVKQFDNIAIETIGLPQDATVVLNPATISVVLSGPIVTLNTLNAEDIRVLIDVNNVGFGNFELSPQVLLRQSDVILDSITPLPATINVVISPLSPELTPEQTPPSG